MGMRAPFLVLITALLGLALVPYPGSPAAASCAGPTLAIEGHDDGRRIPLVPGEEVTVTGRGFSTGCDDTGSQSVTPSCSGDDVGEEGKSEPMSDIELVVLQGKQTPEQISLAVADAGSAEDNELGQVTWTFVVPSTLSPGPAVLETVESEPLRVRIVRPSPVE
ncbi:hypothetical protein GCM10023146_12190 [Nocardioides caricicola]